MKPRNIDPLIAEILDTEIIGNASSDRPLLDACHAVLMDESRSHSQHVLALRTIDRAMGVKSSKYDEAAVLDYRVNTVSEGEMRDDCS